MTKNSALIWTSLSLALSAVACSDGGGDVDIGRNGGNALSDYAAEWDGYAEAFTFWDGSSRVRLSLDSNGHGTLRLGDAPLFPAPKDPNVGYGPAAKWANSPVNNINFEIITPGFEYAVQNAQVLGSRLQLTVPSGAPYRGWCELQTPFPRTDGVRSGYSCLKGDEFTAYEDSPRCVASSHGPDGSTLDSKDVDCGKFILCEDRWPYSPCSCSATGCTDSSEAFFAAQLDGAVEGGGARLTGTLVVSFSSSDRVTIRLHRQ